jgi:molecular chaperone GrpE
MNQRRINMPIDDMPTSEVTQPDPNATPTATAEGNELEALKQSLVELTTLANEEKERALRAMAEADNYRKRIERDMDAFKKFAMEKAILDILPILDSFDLAIQHTAGEPTDAKKMLDGFTMIHRQLQTVLEKWGVARMQTEGQAFDPNLHQAVSQVDSADAQSGSVLSQVQAGYTLQGRVLRPALVIVAK